MQWLTWFDRRTERWSTAVAETARTNGPLRDIGDSMAKKTTHPHPAYASMMAEASRLGWPERFATDLTEHDARALLAAKRDALFLWAIGPLGTVLAFEAETSRARIQRTYYVRTILEALGLDGAEPRFFSWDGTRLASATAQEASELLSSNFESLKQDAIRELEWDRGVAARAAGF